MYPQGTKNVLWKSFEGPLLVTIAREWSVCFSSIMYFSHNPLEKKVKIHVRSISKYHLYSTYPEAFYGAYKK